MKKLEKDIKNYLRERNWHKLRPSDIAKSISIEAAELLELFQWQSMEIKEVKQDKVKLEKLKGELADVFLYAIEMAVLLDLDSEKIIRTKLAHVKEKYPAHLMKKTKKDHGTQEVYLKIKSDYRKKEGR
jgi:NTP pyrophosphatase (non-canonical NTP hydrolase)